MNAYHNMQPERDDKRLARYNAKVKRQNLRALTPKKQPCLWDYKYGNCIGTVRAFTKSEARAEVKEILRMKRLPKDLTLEKQDDTQTK